MKMLHANKKQIFVSLLLVSVSITMGFIEKPTEQNFRIDLETKTDANTFKNYILPQYEGDYNRFEGIPAGITEDNSIVRFLRLHNDTVFILLGDPDANTRICIIDVNKNSDFSDDYVYSFDKSKITEETHFLSQAITYTLNQDDEIVEKQTFFRPVLFDDMSLTVNPGNDLFHKYFVMISPSESYEGVISVDDVSYKIEIPGDIYSKRRSIEYAVLDSTSSLLRAKKKISLYRKLSESTLIDNYLFDSLSLSEDNRELTLQVKNFQNLDALDKQGYEEEFYALPFQDELIDGEKFDLKSYSGKYVLLDFWGSWCNPCIALIPHLASIKENYPDLELISIAVEMDEKGLEKVPGLIEKHAMNWKHIRELFTANDAICTKYHIASFPTTILIDPDGKIIHRGGAAKIGELDEKLEAAFK